MDEKLKELALKITDLTGYGGKLHVNDILPEIREAYELGKEAGYNEVGIYPDKTPH